MTTDSDTVAAPADFLAEVREAAKRRYRDENGRPVDASVDDRQQPAPAAPRNTHIHREAWLHAELHAMTNGRKKQVARLIKCECAECGYVARVARQWIDDQGAPHCPAHGEMTVA